MRKLRRLVAITITFSLMITSITGAGRSASIAYTDGCISTITDENGNRRTFTYDEQHRLISGTDGNNSTYV
ncbi:MAG: RHS repeat protein, partial [Lachnospiraceae bacterium]|nr:RHS repeat protein [Lachnospiraceae bacterium]